MEINNLNRQLQGLTISKVSHSDKKDHDGSLKFAGVQDGKLVNIYITPRDFGLYVEEVVWEKT